MIEARGTRHIAGGGMRENFQIGERVQLSELGKRTAKKPFRTGVVTGVSRSGAQCQVQWDDARLPQLYHVDFLERSASESSGIQ